MEREAREVKDNKVSGPNAGSPRGTERREKMRRMKMSENEWWAWAFIIEEANLDYTHEQGENILFRLR